MSESICQTLEICYNNIRPYYYHAQALIAHLPGNITPTTGIFLIHIIGLCVTEYRKGFRIEYRVLVDHKACSWASRRQCVLHLGIRNRTPIRNPIDRRARVALFVPNLIHVRKRWGHSATVWFNTPIALSAVSHCRVNICWTHPLPRFKQRS